MRKINKLLFFSVLLSFTSSLWASDNYFMCDTIKGELSLRYDNSQVVYEMKNQKGVTFSYASRGPSYSGFLYNHYSRFQTDYVNVSFKQSGLKYTIFSNYEEGKNTRGVTVVNLKTKKEYTYDCKSEGIDKLSDLTGKLQCDKDNALGC